MDLRRLILILAGLAIALAVGLSAMSLIVSLRDRNQSDGVVAIGGPFALVDHTGKTIDDEAFRGRHMLVYFGYTFCPDVCPTELQVISEALDQLGADAAKVRPIFITIDPERDTPEVLADYRQHFHPTLVALTGSREQTATAAKAYRIYFAKAGDVDSEDYLMDHSSFVYLMDADGRYVTHFGPNTPPEDMARRIRDSL